MAEKIIVWPGFTLIDQQQNYAKGPGGADLEEGLTNVVNKDGQKDVYGNSLFASGDNQDRQAAGGLSELNPGQRENAEGGAFSLDGPYVVDGKKLDSEAGICDSLNIGKDAQYGPEKKNFDISGRDYAEMTKNGAYAIGPNTDGAKDSEAQMPRMVSAEEAGPNTIADRIDDRTTGY